MNIKDLYKLEKKDIYRSTEIVSKAFLNYPIHKHIFGDKHNMENVKLFSKFLIKYTVLYGDAYASSPDFEGIILFSESNEYNMNFYRSLRCGILSLMKLGKEAGNRFIVYDDFSLKMRKKNISEPHIYLMLMGVAPERQQQGIGSKMLLWVMKAAEEKGQPCYLETHDAINVAIYKKLGFEVVSEDVVPGSNIVQFCMIKK